MDLLQIALVFLIMLLAVFLSILGIQVFFILRDLKKSLDKIDLLLGDAHQVAQNIEKPLQAAASVAQAVENGVKIAKNVVAKSNKPAKRLFKRR